MMSFTEIKIIKLLLLLLHDYIDLFSRNKTPDYKTYILDEPWTVTQRHFRDVLVYCTEQILPLHRSLRPTCAMAIELYHFASPIALIPNILSMLQL